MGLAELGSDMVSLPYLAALEVLVDLSHGPVRGDLHDLDLSDVGVSAIDFHDVPFPQPVILANRNFDQVPFANDEHDSIEIDRFELGNERVLREAVGLEHHCELG